PFLAGQLGIVESSLAGAMKMTHAKRAAADDEDSDIGMGWFIGRSHGTCWHNGETGGYHGFAGFHVKSKFAVVVLSNTASGVVDELAIDILKTHFGDPVTPIKLRKAFAIDPKILKDYAGDYAILPGFFLRVTVENDRLFAQASNQPKLEVFAESEAKYFYRAMDAQLTFERDATSGKVNRLVFEQGGRSHVAPKLD